MVPLSPSLPTLPSISTLPVDGPATFTSPITSMAEVYTASMATSGALPSGPAPGSIPRHQMSRMIVTVPDLWREWTVGLGNGPAVQALEDLYRA